MKPINKRRKELADRILKDIGPLIIDGTVYHIHRNLAKDYAPELSNLTDADHIAILQALERRIRRAVRT